MSTWTSAEWGTESFRARLGSFIAEAVGEPDSFELVAECPWSAVWRVEAGGATSYAKQNCPGQAHEAGLLQALARVAPDHVVPVLAADPDQDLLLTADLGPTLREQGRVADIDLWCRVVADAAVLQRRVLTGAADLGLTVLRPGDSTTYVANAVGRLAALEVGDPRRLEPEVATLLQALLPTVEQWADRVDELDLPLTVMHNDLHASNVVASEGTLRFFDFGDAVLAEPLGNLFVPLHAVQQELGAAIDDPRLWRIADAAIEVWSDVASPAAMRAALPASLQLARLARVESWRRCVATMTPRERVAFGWTPAKWLTSLLDPAPLAVTPRAGRT